MKHFKRLFMPLVALTAFLLNPHFGCGGSEFDYDAEDMEKAITGTWTVVDADEPSSFDIAAAPAPVSTLHGPRLIRAAQACDSRSFYKTASACSSSSTLAVEAIYVVGSAQGKAKGSFTVGGTQLGGGYIHLELADGSTINGSYEAATPDTIKASWSRKNERDREVTLQRASVTKPNG